MYIIRPEVTKHFPSQTTISKILKICYTTNSNKNKTSFPKKLLPEKLVGLEKFLIYLARLIESICLTSVNNTKELSLKLWLLI